MYCTYNILYLVLLKYHVHVVAWELGTVTVNCWVAVFRQFLRMSVFLSRLRSSCTSASHITLPTVRITYQRAGHCRYSNSYRLHSLSLPSEKYKILQHLARNAVQLTSWNKDIHLISISSCIVCFVCPSGAPLLLSGMSLYLFGRNRVLVHVYPPLIYM